MAEEIKTPWGEIGYITFKRTYSRRLKEDDPNSKTEEYWQVIQRELEAIEKQLKLKFTEEEQYDYARKRLELKFSVAGRFMWQLGTKTVDKLGLPSLQNCAGVVVDAPIRPFTWTMEMLMLGSGVGYNIQKEHVYQLPKLKRKIKITRKDDESADFIVPDTREGWVKLLGKVLKAHFYSGEGFTYSTQLIRGKGAVIRGFGGTASGPEELCWGINEIHKILNSRAGLKLKPIDCLDIMNIIGYVVVAGNVRRSAQIALGDYDDIDFLKAKRWDLGSIPNWRSMSNNSVIAPNDINDLLPEFWQTYDQGEPYGLINMNLCRTVGRTGEKQYPDVNVAVLNPCVTGDTLVAVADGRNAVPIKELVGTECDVYTIKDKKVTIRKSVKTWKTRENAEIWKLTLDDGSILKATPDHLVMLRNGEYKALKQLVPGESLMPFNSYVSNKNYRQIASNTGRDRRQYRLIAEHNGLIVEPKTTAIHHRNFNSFDDIITNLQPMSHEEHKTLHAERMMGANNPLNRMSKDERHKVYANVYNNFGDKNPMYGKKHSEETKILIGNKTKERSTPEYLKELSIAISTSMTSEVRQKISNSRVAYSLANKKEKPIKVAIPAGFTGRQHSEESKLKTSEKLKGRVFTEEHKMKLSEKAKLRYNHKVASIEFIGYDDVYDMTVEDTHNFGVITSNQDDKFVTSSGIFIHNCAEQTLENHETCCLAEVFLPNITTYEELLTVLSYAYRVNKHSLALPCSLLETESIVHKNMRMGIGMTGVLQATEEQRTWLKHAYVWLRQYDIDYSAANNFPPSIKLTTVKPSGTLSLLPGVTPGVHPNPAGPYYLRRVRIAAGSPLIEVCRRNGFNVEPQIKFDGSNDTTTMVVSFPCKLPVKTPVAKNFTFTQQLDNVRALQAEWSDNSVSCTVYYRKEELPAIKVYLAKYFKDEIKTVSFLLYSGHGFIQAPYEDITEEHYLTLAAKTTPITTVEISENDFDVLDCENGACPVK